MAINTTNYSGTVYVYVKYPTDMGQLAAIEAAVCNAVEQIDNNEFDVILETAPASIRKKGD